VILEAVDKWLRMFNANPDSESLLFEENIVLVEELIDITSGVTGGENDSISAKFLPIIDCDSLDLPASMDKVRNL
jgi:hypothetical protein